MIPAFSFSHFFFLNFQPQNDKTAELEVDQLVTFEPGDDVMELLEVLTLPSGTGMVQQEAVLASLMK